MLLKTTPNKVKAQFRDRHAQRVHCMKCPTCSRKINKVPLWHLMHLCTLCFTFTIIYFLLEFI